MSSKEKVPGNSGSSRLEAPHKPRVKPEDYPNRRLLDPDRVDKGAHKPDSPHQSEDNPQQR